MGQEISGDKELGWVGRQVEGAIVVLIVVVGGWFGRTGTTP